MTLILTLLACFPPTEETYAVMSATAGCSRLHRCWLGAFEYTYDDMTECVDEQTELMECYESCDFDDNKAANCLEEIRTMGCGEELDAIEDGDESDCAEVYDCDDDDAEDAYDCVADIQD